MKNDGIRISDILYGIIKHRILLVSMTVAGLLVGIVLSGISFLQGEMNKQYIITSSFSINTQNDNGVFTSGQDFPGYNDINMAEDLAGTVSYVLKSDMMLEDIIDSLSLLGVTIKDISDNLTLQQYGETQIIEMALYWRSSDEGINILTEINRKAPEMLKEILNIGTTSVINQPTAKYIIGGNIDIALLGYTTLIGLGIGVGIMLLKLFTRPTLINVKDIKNVYGNDIVCEIADDPAYFKKRDSILVDNGISPDVRESFASAAHIIQNYFREKEGPHIVYVTSALRGEGKTSVTANLAIQLSELEKHVLLIDLDMRNPNLGGLFLKNVDYAHSLNAFYAGDINKKEAVVTLTGYLDIMPTILERSSIPLDSNLFNVIGQIANEYDYILIDTAPIGLTADPMSLSQIASAALFVVRYDDATLQEIKDALERIKKMKVDLLGCIVNGVKISKNGISNLAKERVKRAETQINTIGDPLVSLKTPKSSENSDEKKNVEDTLVAGFSKNAVSDEKDKQPEIVTSSGDFIDRIFQAESIPKSDIQSEEEKS